ncbi:MAG: hypothetical protein SA378_06745 [Sedimentibacter sp.]|uniref:hypothetical protein n=1 Tax=Sedimentibacter sp. TaxID=1960295 RepID=UPI002980B0A6|nr:hypothetical protein [Sedimentibacter sp.]MDW5299815.1 hypothetical protein [Sedimentibacter sp.]
MINKINSGNPSLSTNKTTLENNNTKGIKNSDTEKTNKKYDSIEINRLILDNEKRINEFKEQIKKMIAKQGEKSNLTLFGQKLNVTVEDSKEAAEQIAEGGEYSVDAVATRIIDMAKALSGDDKSKIPLLKDAVKQGFEAAGLEFNDGAGLPEICNETYDEIMNRFDYWQKE